MGYGELGYHPPTPTLTSMKGPAKPLLGVIVSVSENYVFLFYEILTPMDICRSHSTVTVSHSLLVASGFWNNFTTNVDSARQDWTVVIQN